MTTVSYPLDPVETRLDAEVSALRLIGNAADLKAALDSEPKAMPAAYVLSEERGGAKKSLSGGVFRQDIIVSLQIVLWVRNYARSDSGSGARADMDVLQSAVRAALMGWHYSDDYDPLTLDAQRDEMYKAGTLVSQTIFRSRYTYQSGP